MDGDVRSKVGSPRFTIWRRWLIMAPKSVKSVALPLLKVLTSGGISAVLLALVAAGRLPLGQTFPTELFLVLLQWLALGTLVAKGGLDQFLFARIVAGHEALGRLGSFLLKRSLPVSMIAGAWAAFFLEHWRTAPLISLIIVVDVVSTVRMAELQGFRRYGQAALSNLLNIPLFIMLAAVLSRLTDADFTYVLVLLICSKLVRLGYASRACEMIPTGTSRVVAPLNTLLLQQIVLFLIFRGDQLSISYLADYLPPSISLSQYLFLSKFPEIVSAFTLGLGVVVFPRLVVFFDSMGLPTTVAVALLWVGGTAVTMVGVCAYTLVWNGPSISVPWSLAFGTSAGLGSAFLYLVFTILRSNHPVVALRAQLLGFTAGLCATVVTYLASGFWFPTIFPIVGLGVCLLAGSRLLVQLDTRSPAPHDA